MTDRRSLGPTLYVGTVLVLVSLTAVVVALGGAGASGPAPPAADESEYRVTDDGTRYVVHPSNLRQGCPGGTDCIPSIDDPSFESADGADWLAEEDLVIGVEVDGEARAYPLRILTVHEIVNDEVGGRPLAVTYCPLCRSGLVFDRTVGGETLTFGVSGKLLNANLVMYDRQTETYWSQLNGSAIVGPQVPRQLEIVPSTITTWGEWRETHPDTTVLSRDTGIYPASTYDANPYSDYADSDRVGFGVDEVDRRLDPKRIVYGVAVGDAATAYPEDVVREQRLVQDEVGGLPVLLVETPDGGVAVFSREVDGEVREFELDDGQLVDDAGNRYDFAGTVVAGPDEGTQLDRLNSHGVYWFAWSQFHPGTDVYRGNGTTV